MAQLSKYSINWSINCRLKEYDLLQSDMDTENTHGAFMKYEVQWGDCWKQTFDFPLIFQWQLVHKNVLPFPTSPAHVHHMADLSLGQFKLTKSPILCSNWYLNASCTVTITWQAAMPTKQFRMLSNNLGLSDVMTLIRSTPWGSRTRWHFSMAVAKMGSLRRDFPIPVHSDPMPVKTNHTGRLLPGYNWKNVVSDVKFD